MPRDPNGTKIGRNNRCWCGSGLKYKSCHYNREFQQPRTVGAYENRFYEAEKDIEYCSCEFDAEHSNKIVKAHSVSKSSALSEIAVAGHVYRLAVDLNPQSEAAYDLARFERIGIRLASVFRAFCELHDARLFRELDQMSLQTEGRFFWQLIYRTLSFERYRKKVADRVVPGMRDLDRGKPPHEQAVWQDHISRQSIAHNLGAEGLGSFGRELETMYVANSYNNELAHLYYQIPEKLPLAGAGVFQPDLAPDETVLQRVNRFYEKDGKYYADRLDQLCMAILPNKNGTMLSLCAPRAHTKSIEFMKVFRNISKAVVDNFVGLAVLKMENIYFSPDFVERMPRLAHMKMRSLHSFGMGEDVSADEMRAAMNLGIFSAYTSVDMRSNI